MRQILSAPYLQTSMREYITYNVMSPNSIGRGNYEIMACVYLSIYSVPQPNSTTERPRKAKIGMMESHHTINQ